MAVILVPIAAVVAAGFASAFTVATATLRRRSSTAQQPNGTEHPSDEEKERLVGQQQPGPRPTETRSEVLPLVIAGGLAAAVIAAVLIIGYYFGPGAGSGIPGPGRCEHSPSVRQRLRHAERLGFTHPILTRSSKAQRLFDLGLVQAWNFNQHEAHAAFSLAAAEDPACARCWWGVAYALGPGANRDVVDEPQQYPSFSRQDFPATRAAAHQAWQLAEAALKREPDSELAQRDALWCRAALQRFRGGSDRQPGRGEAELEYAALVEAIGEQYQDADAFAIAAEAHMNLSPWDYYLPRNATQEYVLRPNAAQAERLIARALALRPRHPFAAHLLIHLSEASDPRRGAPVSAGRAEAVAQLLLDRGGPAATMGHLLHMPSHTYVRVGRYHDATIANIRAHEADEEDVRSCRVPFEPEHNTDMLIYAAVQSGQYRVARAWAARIRSHQQELHTAAFGDGSFSWTHLPLVYAAFGDWQSVLAAPPPPPTARDNCPTPGHHSMATAVWHYTRCLALAARIRADSGGASALQLKAVTDEQAAFEAAAAGVPQEETTVPGEWPGIYACDRRKLLSVYNSTLRAALATLHGDVATAEAELRAAVATEDAMGYMEPPRLYRPVRQCLGVLLMATSRPADAWQVFRDDLAIHPGAGRSIAGLAKSLREYGRQQEGDAILQGLRKGPWRHADSPSRPCPGFPRLPAAGSRKPEVQPDAGHKAQAPAEQRSSLP